MSANRKEARKKAQKQSNTIQIVAIAVIVVGVLVIIAALVMPSIKSPIPSIPPQVLTNPPTDSSPTQTPQPKSTPAGAPTATAPTQTPAATVAIKQYASAPPMTVDPKKQYFADFKLAKGGEFVVQLYPDKAPITVNSFVFLAKDGFFNGVTFHRVLEGFMAQGGDPTGTGMGGPGYQFGYEANDLKFDKPGVLAMANNGPRTPTNGSQFFITFVPVAQLDNGYTIFGQVISGMDVVNGITRRDPDQNPTFSGDAIQTITITEK